MYWMNGKDKVFAYGARWGYLVLRSETDVRLSRFPVDLAAANMTAAVAAETVRNVIVFPLGRGPGRPGGEPELTVLMESAKTFAEVFEAGEDLEGYPAWRHPLVTKTGRVLTDADVQALADEAEQGYDVARFRVREGETVRFLGEPSALTFAHDVRDPNAAPAKVPHDHGRALSDDAMSPAADGCPFVLVSLPCGCQDVHYACGYVDREHDHVACSGIPASTE